MNYFQLVIKQMRQRALSTWLTTLSVMLGVGLAIAIMVLGRESEALFGQNDFGYDAIVGKKGSKLELVLNTVYHMDVSPGNIPYTAYTSLLKPGPGPVPPDNLYHDARIAVPTVVGDTLNGQYRIVGTLPKLFGMDDNGKPLPPDEVLDYRPDKKMEIDRGQVFAGNKFEAIVGSDIPRLTGKDIGSTFQATHGTPIPGQPPDIHMQVWKVVGVLKPTHTAIDRVVYIPLISFYTIAEHGAGLLAQHQIREGEKVDTFDPDSDSDQAHPPDANHIEHFSNYDLDVTDPNNQIIKLKLSPEIWAISAILVQSRGGNSEAELEYDLNNGTDVMACNPASVMREFFDQFLKPTRKLLLIICSLVTIVAAVGILVSIYNSVSARLREIAILRALGATKNTVLTLICLEAGLVAAIGAALGLIVGHAICFGGSIYMQEMFGEGINWLSANWLEFAYLAAVVVLALIAGLVPALKAYSTPVATNLTSA
jgi:putative ABC transport system permease protein